METIYQERAQAAYQFEALMVSAHAVAWVDVQAKVRELQSLSYRPIVEMLRRNRIDTQLSNESWVPLIRELFDLQMWS